MIYNGMDGAQVDQAVAKLLEDGFLNGVDFGRYADEDSRIKFGELRDLFVSCKCRKYALKYFLVHRQLMPEWGTPSVYRDPDKAEELYKACLEQGTTWKHYTGYKDDGKTLY